jgi:hypothetical protein
LFGGKAPAPAVSPAAVPESGVSLRSEVRRLASLGEQANPIAERLSLPLADVEMLLRVDRLEKAREAVVSMQEWARKPRGNATAHAGEEIFIHHTDKMLDRELISSTVR